MTLTQPTAQEAEAILAALWERNYDPLTTELIGRLPLGPGARCLDIGAGAGSMTKWLAARVPQGSVLAVDVNTDGLDDVRVPGVTVRQGDIETEQFAPGSFDFILARGVFSVLKSPDELLSRAVRWLAPGGWVLVEDFYFMPAEDAATPLGHRVIEAYLRAFRAQGADMRFARRLPARLAAEGLAGVDFHLRPLGPGQGQYENELMRRRLELQGQPLVDNGWVSAQDLADFVATIEAPASRDVTTLLFSVWGQRPPV
ncbi:class I SAM-dependent methyltransferase [Micromonospora sp. NPDC005174]|uniref:class I SAM-dependent methyltransferase n=1 Tax=Micromonospora sp. NPDC005174 TaxID=3157018 RepID=UPI0033BED353